MPEVATSSHTANSMSRFINVPFNMRAANKLTPKEAGNKITQSSHGSFKKNFDYRPSAPLRHSG
jgi:hypothetical protein